RPADEGTTDLAAKAHRHEGGRNPSRQGRTTGRYRTPPQRRKDQRRAIREVQKEPQREIFPGRSSGRFRSAGQSPKNPGTKDRRVKCRTTDACAAIQSGNPSQGPKGA